MRRRGSRFSWTCFFRGHRFPGGPVPDDGPQQVEAMSVPCGRCGNDRTAASFTPDTLGHWLWILRTRLAWLLREARGAAGRGPARDKSEPDDIPF